MSKSILILGQYRQTIVVVRSLARAGYRIVLGRSEAGFVGCSRYVSARWDHPSDETEPHVFQAALAEHLARNPGLIVFPVGERQLELVAGLSDVERARATAWVMPASEIILECLDKEKSRLLAEKCGLPVPATRLAAGGKAVGEAAHALGLPVVLKRRDSRRLLLGYKAVIADDEAGLAAALSRLDSEERDSILVQRKALGLRRNCHFVAVEGRVLAYFEQKVLRTDMSNDTGYGVEGISVEPTAKLRAYVEAMAGAYQYSGAGCLQFLVSDATGEAAFLEINPRLDATCALPYFCGVDFPRLALEAALGLKPRAPAAGYRVGIRVHWLAGDLLGWFHALRWREVDFRGAGRWLRQMIWATFSADRQLTWDWRDPLPSVYVYCLSVPGSILRALYRSIRPRSGERQA